MSSFLYKFLIGNPRALSVFAIGSSIHYYTHHFRHSKPQRPQPTLRAVTHQYSEAQEVEEKVQEKNIKEYFYDMCSVIDALEFIKFGSTLAEAEEATEKPSVPPKGAFFKHAASMIPHFEKRYKGGEDAYLERPDLLVVADGVGGWGEVGVDPGLFSKALVKLIEEEYVKNPVQGKLKEYLIEAVKKNKNVGSSTCVLAKFGGVQDGQVVMETTNLGDSGYMIIRAPEVGSKNLEPLEVIFRSKEQQYRFNFPYQCGTDCELPYAAEDKQHQMRSNDIVIMASDGLFDNLYHEDVLSCLKPHYRPSAQSRAATGEVTNLFGAADCMARKAEKLGLDQGYMSPFARGAQQVGIPYRGGKADDVTVIVAQVNFKYQ